MTKEFQDFLNNFITKAYGDVRSNYTTLSTALNGFMDKDCPDDVKTALKPLIEQVNAKLSGMQPLEQIASANQASYALNSMADALTYASRLQASMTETMHKMKSDFASARNTEIATAINGKLEKGELFDRAALDQAVKAEQDKFKLTREREAACATHSLPVPTDAAVLALPEDKWAPVLNTAKTRAAALKEKASALNGADLADVLFGEEKIFKLVLGSAPAKSANGKPAADPLLGQTEKKDGEKKYAGAC